jgi:predicted nucleic acid binding AN1-type Zn finger protein
MNYLIGLGVLFLLVLAFFIWKEFSAKRSSLPVPGKQEVQRMLQERLFLPKEVGMGRKKAPIAGRCYQCGRRVTMPYKCKFCGGLYCDKHRLPESHECEGLKSLKRDKEG